MLNRVLVAVLLLSASGVGYAGEEYITQDTEQFYYGDRTSLRRNGDTVRAWVRWVPVFKDDFHPSEGALPTVDDVKPNSMIQNVLYSFRCTDLMIGTIQFVRYADPFRQNVAESWSDPTPDELSYTYVVPNSVGERFLQWACKSAQAKPKNSSKTKLLRNP